MWHVWSWFCCWHNVVFCMCVRVLGLSDAIRCHLSARTQTGLWHYDLTLAKVSEHLVPWSTTPSECCSRSVIGCLSCTWAFILCNTF
jgi:hypothetical protein